jgi:D-alanine-D-alanine ligase
MVLDNLDEQRFEVSSIEITQDGDWLFSDALGEYLEISRALGKLRDMGPDCVFIALHGPYGEDGKVQGLLDLMGIRYTGSGCSSSGLAIDKIRSKLVMRQLGVAVPDEIDIDAGEWASDRSGLITKVRESFGFPCVVKNPVQGSSLGMGIPKTEQEFAPEMDRVFGFGDELMVERLVSGVEVTCGVLDGVDGGTAEVLPVTEIRPESSEFFDFHAKYTASAVQEITPAEIDDALRQRVQEIALCAHGALGCSGFSRSDMIIADDEVFWLETNTIPGLTETSLLPQGAAAAGISFSELLTRIVESALR